ncbi:GspH/FimT family pseudopilin [Zhongshania aliphaticivorans]|nr:GspH/FimT family pseudopilin [Zhongshania aliphaticivorans]
MMKILGMTLIELISTLAVSAVLSLVAIPSLYQTLQQHRLKASAHTLFQALNSARASAVIRNQHVTVWNNDGDWTADVEIFIDDNENGERDSGELLLHRSADHSSINISGNRWVADYIKFHSDGSAHTANGAFQVGTITFCSEDLADTAYQIVLSIGGRLRMVKTTIEEC